jgi:hypothetical protein
VTAVYRVQWQHPQECTVCDRLGLVAFSRVGYGNTGRGVAPEVSRLSSVICCPQCTDAGELLAHLPGDWPAPFDGGGAA